MMGGFGVAALAEVVVRVEGWWSLGRSWRVMSWLWLWNMASIPHICLSLESEFRP